MSSFNTLLPIGSMTLTDQKAYRMQAVAAGIERAASKDIGNIGDEIPGYRLARDKADRVARILGFLATEGIPPSIDVRDFQPILDAVTALDQWNTAALAAVGINYSCFQAVPAPVMAANRLVVWYKVGIETVPPPVSRLTFRSGGALGNIVGIFDLEQLYQRLETEGYLSEPVIFDPTMTYAVQVMARVATGLLSIVTLGGLIFEPAGQVIA